MHEGGVNTCFADGSVHWISDYIDISGNYNASPPLLSVWDRLILSADGQVIPGNAYSVLCQRWFDGWVARPERAWLGGSPRPFGRATPQSTLTEH